MTNTTKSEVVDEFWKDLPCPSCQLFSEHHVQKIIEFHKGEHVGVAFYAQCDVCENIEEYPVGELGEMEIEQ